MSIKKIQLIHVAQKAMARINRFSKQVYLWVPTSVNCVEDQQTLKNIRLQTNLQLRPPLLNDRFSKKYKIF